MSLGSIADVHQRIAEINRFTQSFAPQIATPSTTAAPSSTANRGGGSSSNDFNQLLQTTLDRVSAGTRLGGTATTLQSNRNGRLLDSELSPIGVGNHRLVPNAASAFRQMNADAQAAGISIGVNDSYRTYDEQVALAKREGLYAQGGLAAAPGSSHHGLGIALDLKLTPASQTWLQNNASRYGFAAAVPREPWHWEYTPGTQ